MIFSEIAQPPVGNAVHLVLGGTEGAAGTVTDASLRAVLRIVVAAVATAAKQGASATHQIPWSSTGLQRHSATLPWRAFAGTTPRRSTALPWGAFAGTNPRSAAPIPWDLATRHDTDATLAWDLATQHDTDAALPWDQADAAQRRAALPWGLATPRHIGALAPWGPADSAAAHAALPWGLAALLPGAYRPAGDTDFGSVPAAIEQMHFCTPATYDSLDLVLGDDICITQPRIADGIVIPAQRTYMQSHSLTALRLPDMVPVPLTSIDISADEGSFGWTLNANGTTDVLTLLGSQSQLRVTLDGMVWDFVVEGTRRTRNFGATSASITARSVASLLADMPVSAWLNSVPATAQQLVVEALQYTGVDLDWQVTDWLVPAGAWTHSGTPLSAVLRVAESIGAIVQCPRTGDVIKIVPRYPVLPWHWAASRPDVTLALDAVVSEGFERADKAAYEGVYVSGQAQGILAMVKRTGSAPALLMPSITDALITDLDAARQRGESMLGAAGPQAVMTLTLPVLAGVIDVNKLVLVNDPAGAWKGRVRSVSLRADHVSARQTISLERHL